MLQVLLAEEPHEKLSSELRLQAIATITALRYCPTAAGMALQPQGTILAVLGCCSLPLGLAKEQRESCSPAGPQL